MLQGRKCSSTWGCYLLLLLTLPSFPTLARRPRRVGSLLQFRENRVNLSQRLLGQFVKLGNRQYPPDRDGIETHLL